MYTGRVAGHGRHRGHCLRELDGSELPRARPHGRARACTARRPRGNHMDAVAADAAADVDGTRAPTSRSIRGVELSIDRSAAALDRERGKRRSRRARRAMGSPGEEGTRPCSLAPLAVAACACSPPCSIRWCGRTPHLRLSSMSNLILSSSYSIWLRPQLSCSLWVFGSQCKNVFPPLLSLLLARC